ncbi:sensor histidine kinase [Zunongwangia sp. H14]|uniref:sensor histidine kinase n=1 Tax=Zunongwangia sp. H14 TaxID=3240792 RepID=UPI0035637B8F
MEKVRRNFILIHIGLWLLLALLLIAQLTAGDHNPNWATLTAGVLGSSLYVFYGRFYHLNHYQFKARPLSYLLGLLFLISTGPLPLVLFQLHRDDWELIKDFYKMSLVTLVPIFLILSWVARLTQNLIMNTILKEQLEKQAVETELSYLKSQINPHFLFNTLNNIHTLVYKQKPAAPEALMRLSSLLRYMIYESNATFVPLSKEIEYLKDYIGLQQLRYQTPEVANIQISGDINSCTIAPLLFIHFLENAYKHSPGRLKNGDIKISIKVAEDRLTFRIENPIDEKKDQSLEQSEGIGLPNVQKRLALVYPENHKLEINDSENLHRVKLEIFNIEKV